MSKNYVLIGKLRLVETGQAGGAAVPPDFC